MYGITKENARLISQAIHVGCFTFGEDEERECMAVRDKLRAYADEPTTVVPCRFVPILGGLEYYAYNLGGAKVHFEVNSWSNMRNILKPPHRRPSCGDADYKSESGGWLRVDAAVARTWASNGRMAVRAVYDV